MLRCPIKWFSLYIPTPTIQKPTEQRIEQRREGNLLAKGVNYKRWTPRTQQVRGQLEQETQGIQS